MGRREEVPGNLNRDVNVNVIAVKLLMGGFVAVWIVRPCCRSWFEASKWQPLGWDQPPRTLEEDCH
jgi:hypothetical protein